MTRLDDNIDHGDFHLEDCLDSTIAGRSYEKAPGKVESMRDKKKTCQGCKYVLADTTYRKGNGYYCINQNSENFGRDVKELSGCAGYDRFNPKPDMPFKDALDKLVMGPKGAYPSYFFLYGREGELHRPFLCITFVDNKQMLEYIDASMRCFDELMKLKTEAGDFKDDPNE